MTLNPSALIHHLAHVGPDVTIGARTRVWQFASIIRKSEVGDDCSVATCATIDGSRVGHQTIICHGAILNPGIKVGNRCFVGQNAALCNDVWPREYKHDWHNMKELLEGWLVVTILEDAASVGANATVMPGLRIGAGAMIAAGAVVTANVPPWHLYKRDGSIVPIDRDRKINRRRTVLGGGKAGEPPEVVVPLPRGRKKEKP